MSRLILTVFIFSVSGQILEYEYLEITRHDPMYDEDLIGSELDSILPRLNPVCGRLSKELLTSRIVGGTEAQPGDFPWQASLRRSDRRHACGASVIGEEWVLTAAHCIGSGPNRPWFVLVGSQYHDNRDGVGKNHVVHEIIVHPHFDRKTINNDVALIKVSPPITLNYGDSRGRGAVEPVCLPGSGHRALPSSATVSGWGLLEEKGDKVSESLMAVDVDIQEYDTCRRSYRDMFKPDTMLCAGYDGGGRDSCQGDSGSPLVTRDGGRAEQIGVVSFGLGCGREEYPGIYSKVSAFRDWIQEQTGI